MNGDLRIYPESGYVVAVLSNLDPPIAQRISYFLIPVAAQKLDDLMIPDGYYSRLHWVKSDPGA
jgi:hypothetical protein